MIFESDSEDNDDWWLVFDANNLDAGGYIYSMWDADWVWTASSTPQFPLTDITDLIKQETNIPSVKQEVW